MNTEQDIEEKSIPNGDYTDRDLRNSKRGPESTRKAQMKPESRENVKNQYVGYRWRVRKKLQKKDQEIKIYQGIINTDSTLTNLNIEDLKSRISKLDNDKKIIILNSERYNLKTFPRYKAKAIKLAKKIFSTIKNKIYDFISTIDIDDMDFDQKSAEDMLSVGFNNLNTPIDTQPQVQATEKDEQSQDKPTSTGVDENKKEDVSDLFSETSKVEQPISLPSIDQGGPPFEVGGVPLLEQSDYSVLDTDGSELMNWKDVNQLNQSNDKLVSQDDTTLKLTEVDHNMEVPLMDGEDDLETFLQHISEVYQSEMNRQKQLQQEAEKYREEEVEAKKQAEIAVDRERSAKEKQYEANQLAKEANEKAKEARKELREKLDLITKQVSEIKKQNERLESTIEEKTTNIRSYEQDRQTAEANADEIIEAVNQQYNTIRSQEKQTTLTESKIAELNQMLGVSIQLDDEKFTQQSINPYSTDNSEMERMMVDFEHQTGRLPDLDLNSSLSSSSSVQGGKSVGKR